MPFERFGYLVLEQREMVCQHVVKKCRDSHFVASDYMKHLLYAVVVLLADIDLLAEPCRDIGTAYEYCVIIQFSRLAVPAPAFRLLFGVRGGWRNGFLYRFFRRWDRSVPVRASRSGGMLVSSSRNELITASLSMSSILVFFAMPFSF